MGKTFTDDETGQKYALVGTGTNQVIEGNLTVIAPIPPPTPAEEKNTYKLEMWMTAGETTMGLGLPAMTPTQATALAEAIKALVEFCTNNNPHEADLWQDDSGLGAKVANTVNRARKALNGTQGGAGDE